MVGGVWRSWQCQEEPCWLCRELGAAQLIPPPQSCSWSWEWGGLELVHGSDTESLHDLGRWDTMVMNTAQMSGRIEWMGRALGLTNICVSPLSVLPCSKPPSLLLSVGDRSLVCAGEGGEAQPQWTQGQAGSQAGSGALLEGAALHGRKALEWESGFSQALLQPCAWP